MRRFLPLLVLASASASVQAAPAPVDLLSLIFKDGVFRSTAAVPKDRTPPNSRAWQLKPDSFGGEWFLTLTGPKTGVGTAHVNYAGSKADFPAGAVAVAKLTARLAGQLAQNCFSAPPEKLRSLTAWVEEKVRLGARMNLNMEQSYGPVRVQLLVNQTDGDTDAPKGLVEVDVFLSRSGTPGSGAWVNTCTK